MSSVTFCLNSEECPLQLALAIGRDVWVGRLIMRGGVPLASTKYLIELCSNGDCWKVWFLCRV